MKRIISLLVVTVILSTALFAQQRGPKEQLTPEKQAEQTIKKLHAELQLTEKQQAELKTWYTALYQNKKDDFEKMKQERESMREKMQDKIKKDKEATDAKLKKVLTAEQYKKYQEYEKKAEKERKERMQHMKAGDRRR